LKLDPASEPSRGESDVGRTANSWRTWNARLQHIRANCIALDAETPRDPEPSTRWAVFLRNHREVIAAMDFFTVPTLELWRALLFRRHRPMTDIDSWIEIRKQE
jgi:hypothetical protein